MTTTNMTNRPNYQTRNTKEPLFAIRASLDPRVINIIGPILGEGGKFAVGEWVTVCHCADCAADKDGSVIMWSEKDFHKKFERIPVAKPVRSAADNLANFKGIPKPTVKFSDALGRMIDNLRMQAGGSPVMAVTETAKTATQVRNETTEARFPKMGFIAQTKSFRKDLDGTLQQLKGSARYSRERNLAITKLQECIMWLGMDLKALGTDNPYPSSYDASSPVVEPTADGLKL